MNYSEAEDSWKSNDEWRYADKEAAWKFFFAAGKDAPQKVISAQCVKMNQYENIIFELRDQLAKAEQLWQIAQGRCDGLEEKLAKAEQRYLAWEGGEEWEQLAFQLCADECGEESCNELIWEGCPPEPWGERWLKYESEAKRIIQLVRQYAPDKKAEQRVAEWQPIETAPKDGSFILLATPKGRIADGFWSLVYGVWSWPYVVVEPTHWMPMPKAPNGASS